MGYCFHLPTPKSQVFLQGNRNFLPARLFLRPSTYLMETKNCFEWGLVSFFSRKYGRKEQAPQIVHENLTA